MKKEPRETPRKKFIQIVKKKGKVYASPSHTQHYPDHIDSAAILEWQHDPASDELFSVTKLGRRVVSNTGVPAFHIWRIGGLAIERYKNQKENS